MKVKLLSTTNYYAEELENIIGDLSIGLTFSFNFNNDENGNWTPSFDLRRGIWKSSFINSIEYKEVTRNYFEITIKTKNSTYVFSTGEKSDKEPLTDKEILDMQIALGMHLF